MNRIAALVAMASLVLVAACSPFSQHRRLTINNPAGTSLDQPYGNGPANGSGPLPLTANLNYYGADRYYIESSTAADQAALLVSGSGFFYGVECSSGSVGDFLNLYDSNTISGITATTKGKALGPQVWSAVLVATNTNAGNLNFNSGVSCLSTVNCGKFYPAHGADRFANGIVGLKHGFSGSGGSENCVIHALTDATIQSGVH